MADWVTISQVATAGGTLALAAATYSSIRAAQASTRLAERAMLAAQRPLLVHSNADDLTELVRFGDEVTITVPGHSGAAVNKDSGLYLGLSLRNGGTGMAMIHSWHTFADHDRRGDPPQLDAFRPQQLDILVPANSTGVWRGAIREDEDSAEVRDALARGDRIYIDLLYSDHEGGQRAVARFALPTSAEDNGGRVELLRYWNV
ncbi:MAG: hypothetical protein J2O48_04810 [Solirubrobacterales bacterium]|nr:hypothetical protein [Solirubrobacterales bacterium]